MAGWLALALAAATAYFGTLNAYVLYRSVPLPYTLELHSPLVAAPAEAYSVSLAWEPMQLATGEPIRPSVHLDGLLIPTTGSGIPVGRQQGGDVPLELRVVVPGAAAAGEHRGQLVFQRTVPSDALPPSSSVPIRVQVSGGFWSSWFVLRDWLLMVVAILGLLYLFCLVIFPAPGGTLLVLASKGGHYRKHTVRLRLARWAWLFPWRRSVVPLSRVFRSAGVENMVRGELLFVGPTLPVLFWDSGGRPDGVGRRRGDDSPLEMAVDEPFERCARIDTMYESNTYRLSDSSGTDALFLRFTSRTRGA